MKKVLIFTGAGFSHPLGLPLTDGFQDLINKTDSLLLGELNRYLKGKEKDVEHTLSACEQLLSGGGFLHDIVKRRRTTDNNYKYVDGELTKIESQAKKLITGIQDGIFETLVNVDRLRCSVLYSQLLLELRKTISQPTAFSIFSTNYDLSFEEALRHDNNLFFRVLKIKNLVDGFINNFNMIVFEPDLPFEWAEDTLEYKKLHGSIDWTKHIDGRCYKSGSGNTPKNASSMPLLYPGFKGVPKTEPFRSLHRQLQARLSSADIVISIGFAYRDPYINNIFNASFLINENLKVLCFDPKDLKTLPDESAIPEFLEELPKRFFYIQKGIIANKLPLDLKNIRSYIHGKDNETIDETYNIIQNLFN